MKIAFLDSGIGGLSVVYSARKALPEADILFYADCDNAPYGEKTVEEVRALTFRSARFLLEKGAEAIVIACNTATSAACKALREALPVPVVGMEPAVKKALELCPDKRVLVVATPVTIRGEKLRTLIEKVDSRHLADGHALPGLVRFAEQEIFEQETVTDYLRQELSGYPLSEYSSLVLGCTHFNYFKDSFRALLPPSVRILDGNEGTVRQLIRRLRECPQKTAGSGKTEVFFSGRPASEEELRRIGRLTDRLRRMEEIF